MSQDEKRASFRLSMSLSCSLHIAREGSAESEAVEIRNLSPGGVLFVCASPLSPGERIAVTITPSRKDRPPMRKTAEVLRCHPVQPHHGFEVACRFADEPESPDARRM